MDCSVWHADLPMLLQALRGCYNLKTLLISGNPVTQEKQFRAHMLKTVPSLEEMVVDAGAGEEQGLPAGRRRQHTLPDVITSSSIYTTCLNHIEEQDQLRAEQKEAME